MRGKWLFIFGVIFSFIFVLSKVWGYNGWEKNIPNGTVFSCNNCHLPDFSAKTPFGNDYKSHGNAWNVSLATIDSDADGYTNGVELQDPNGTWVKGQPNPGDPNLVSNPGDPNSVPPVPGPCNTWADVIAKYSEYVGGSATWSDVIACYNEYATP